MVSLQSPFLALALAASVAGASASSHEPNGFEAPFRRFADKHCVSCHGPDVQRRQLRLDQLKPAFDDRDAAATWVKVLDRVARGEMPPKSEERPPEAETGEVLAAL